jgi:hypothetical protein
VAVTYFLVRWLWAPVLVLDDNCSRDEALSASVELVESGVDWWVTFGYAALTYLMSAFPGAIVLMILVLIAGPIGVLIGSAVMFAVAAVGVSCFLAAAYVQVHDDGAADAVPPPVAPELSV